MDAVRPERSVVGGNPTARLAGINPNKEHALHQQQHPRGHRRPYLVVQRNVQPHGPVIAGDGVPTAAMLGVSFMGGSGSLGSAFVGITLISTLSYACDDAAALWFTFNGLLLVIALTIDSRVQKSERAWPRPACSCPAWDVSRRLRKTEIQRPGRKQPAQPEQVLTITEEKL